MQWDGKVQPRLLANAAVDRSESKVIKSITGYGFEDQEKRVKVYVSFPGVGELELKIEHDEDQFTLSINAADATHVLKVDCYESISAAKLKKKTDKLVLTLTKFLPRS